MSDSYNLTINAQTSKDSEIHENLYSSIPENQKIIEPEKPPTQVLSITGMDAPPVMLGSSINWGKLITLPPYQMYIASLGIKTDEESIVEFLKQESERIGLEAHFDAYCQWHKAKGYWPNETPDGRIIEV